MPSSTTVTAAPAPSGAGAGGAGYEGCDLPRFVADLAADGVATVIDVRLNPISRKPGFSKRALAAALSEAGIGYVHEPALGNPKPNRAGFAARGPERELAHAAYRCLLDAEPARAALRRVAQAASVSRVALLCFEADPADCHRALILERLAELTGTR